MWEGRNALPRVEIQTGGALGLGGQQGLLRRRALFGGVNLQPAVAADVSTERSRVALGEAAQDALDEEIHHE